MLFPHAGRRPFSTKTENFSVTPSAAAATTTATATTATATETTTTTARRALLGFVHLQVAAVEHGAVQLRDGRIGGRRTAHGDEREAAGLTRFTIRRDGDLADLAGGGEEGLQVCLRRVVREISNV